MEVGDFAEAEMIAGPNEMAKAQRLGPDDEFPEVWATSRMILLMEIAATRLMKPIVGPGNMSVGVGVTVKHIAATPINSKVRARATYLEREGKLYKFTVEAFDEGGKVGEGDHTRAIVSTQRLEARAAARGK
jgi:fluoroacetyl-CoA thioesterase